MKKAAIAVIGIGLAVSGCAPGYSGYGASPYGAGAFGANKTTAGMLGGAALGGLGGAQIGGGSGKLAAVAAGTLLGAFLGHGIGTSLDRADEMYAAQAEREALQAPLHQPVSWQGQSGNHGTVTPMREYPGQYGEYCREYQHTIIIGGKRQRGIGRACQNPDGTWTLGR